MNWKVLIYVLLWVFCWPIALYITLDFIVFAIKLAAEKSEQQRELKEKNKMLY